MTGVVNRLRSAAAGYAPGRGRPLRGYLATLGAYAGLVGGLACAALTQAAARNFFGRVVARLDREARAALVIYLEGLALGWTLVRVGERSAWVAPEE